MSLKKTTIYLLRYKYFRYLKLSIISLTYVYKKNVYKSFDNNKMFWIMFFPLNINSLLPKAISLTSPPKETSIFYPL